MTFRDANLTIMVKDMDRSVSFYQSIGFQLKNRWGNHYAQLDGPGIHIGLHPAGVETGSGPGTLSVGFRVDQLEEAGRFLKDLSITTEARSEEGGQFLHFTDPDGTPLYLIKPKWG